VLLQVAKARVGLLVEQLVDERAPRPHPEGGDQQPRKVDRGGRLGGRRLVRGVAQRVVVAGLGEDHALARLAGVFARGVAEHRLGRPPARVGMGVEEAGQVGGQPSAIRGVHETRSDHGHAGGLVANGARQRGHVGAERGRPVGVAAVVELVRPFEGVDVVSHHLERVGHGARRVALHVTGGERGADAGRTSRAEARSQRLDGGRHRVADMAHSELAQPCHQLRLTGVGGVDVVEMDDDPDGVHEGLGRELAAA
jgi:hypothetical protein